MQTLLHGLHVFSLAHTIEHAAKSVISDQFQMVARAVRGHTHLGERNDKVAPVDMVHLPACVLTQHAQCVPHLLPGATDEVD